MNSLIATPMRGQPPFLARASEPVMPYEPILSTGGLPDELSASEAAGFAAWYAKCHAEVDADDDARNAEAARDFTAAEFLDQVRADCPGLIATFSAFSYVHLDCFPDQPPVSERYEARAKFPDGSPLRNIEAPTWKELAEKLVAEFRARKGLRAVPVIEAAAV